MANYLAKLMQNTEREIRKSINTSIPATIISYDANTGLAECQVMIKSVSRSGEQITLPPVTEVYVAQYGDKEWFIETQVTEGTEGSLFFSQRCYEDWRESGEVSGQSVIRFHNISDAYFLPGGVRSTPNKINEHSNDGIKIRNAENTKYFHMKKNGDIEIEAENLGLNCSDISINAKEISIEATNLQLNADTAEVTAKFILNGDMQHNGSTTQTGSTDSSALSAPSIKALGAELALHSHAGTTLLIDGAPGRAAGNVVPLT